MSVWQSKPAHEWGTFVALTSVLAL